MRLPFRNRPDVGVGGGVAVGVRVEIVVDEVLDMGMGMGMQCLRPTVRIQRIQNILSKGTYARYR